MTKAGDRILASIEKARAYARGEDAPGFRVSVPDVIDAARIRKKQGLSQDKFSAKYGFPLATLQDWEQKRRVPDRSAQIFLIAIDSEPEIIHRAAVAGGFAKVVKLTSKPVGVVRSKPLKTTKVAVKSKAGAPARKTAKLGRKRIEA